VFIFHHSSTASTDQPHTSNNIHSNHLNRLLWKKRPRECKSYSGVYN